MSRVFLPALLVLAACSSSTPKPVNDAPKPKSTGATPSNKPAPDIKAEVGGLDQRAVKKNFESLLQRVERCQDDRRKQNEKLDFLAGDLKIEVHVGEDGSVRSSFLPHSTLGDRALEKCITDAARSLEWPRPQGGLKGIATNEFSLPMKGDREAVPWETSKADSTIAKARSALSACKAGTKGELEVTVYVDTDGKVLAAGASQPDADKASAPDCAVDAVKGLKFPSPGGWPAKVTVRF